MIRILQFCISGKKDGRTQAILENAKHIDRTKFVFDYIAFGDKLPFENKIREQGGMVHYISCSAEENREQFIKEMDMAMKNNYDIIHIHFSLLRSMLVEEIARKNGIKRIIMHSHNTDVNVQVTSSYYDEVREEHIKKRNLLNENSATDFWSCSWKAADWLYGDQIPKEKIVIVKDSIDSHRFEFNELTRKMVRGKYNLQDKFVIGHIGRFAFQKNHEFLIDVFFELKKKMKDAFLLMEGIGPLKEQVVDKVKRYGLEKDVLFLERYENIEELYQAMDMFVFPSRFEGFGRVLLEAQCAGLKAITSTAVPNDVLVSDNIVRLPLEDATKWADWIIENKDYNRVDMKKCIVESGYDIVENVRELERLYEQ